MGENSSAQHRRNQQEFLGEYFHLQQQQQPQFHIQQLMSSRFPSEINFDFHPQQRNANLNPSPSRPSFNPKSINAQINLNLGILENPQQIQQKAIQPSGELQMAYQDAMRVCNPDFNTPFTNLEDACERLLPYHVVATYEEEDDDGAQAQQRWDERIEAKVAELTSTFEKQVDVFNKLTQGQAKGDFRAEERLIILHDLLKDEKDLYNGIITNTSFMSPK